MPEPIEQASTHMQEMRFPDLQRPAVRPNEPPTLELINWAVQLYCYSLLAHFREILRSFLVLVHNGLLPASFTAARTLFEMGAHAYYTHKHIVQFLDERNLKGAWDFLFEINAGSRYMREEYGDQPEELPAFPAPREIARVIRCFDERMKGKAATEYSFLSEFAHPNMAAFSYYYKLEETDADHSVVRFVAPTRELSSAPWSNVSISLIACLNFMLLLLRRSAEAEAEAARQVDAIFKEFIASADQHE